MNLNYLAVERRGKKSMFPKVEIGDRTIIINGRWIRMATIYQEGWMEDEPVEKPEWFVLRIKELGLKADIFSFSRRLPENTVSYPFHYDWDNAAAMPISSFDDWRDNRISRKTRQEVNRAHKYGIVVKEKPFNEELIQEIVSLFNRISIKQGLPFTHHGKDYEKVYNDVSPYIERSVFIGAYYKYELVGYLKIVFMDRLASILNIITDPIHFEKRPGNALLAEAVKVCVKKGVIYLLYGKYAYGNKVNSSLAEFKRRNGFEMIRLPRYYVPLSLKGRMIIKLKLYRGLLGLIPESLILPLLSFRSRIYKNILIPIKTSSLLRILHVLRAKKTR